MGSGHVCNPIVLFPTKVPQAGLSNVSFSSSRRDCELSLICIIDQTKDAR